LIGLIAVLLAFVFSVMALAQVGNGGSCHWAFPKWFGCVLSTHESLAAGLIGTAGALVAAWVAWSAVQQQIKDERERALADRREAERLLVDDLTDYADVMAAGWRLLVDLPEKADESLRHRVFDGVAFMAKHLSRPEQIANYRAMADILGWDRRRRYNALLRGLEGLGQFDSAERITVPDEPLQGLSEVFHTISNTVYPTPTTFLPVFGAVTLKR
jgi:hypothetical protein